MRNPQSPSWGTGWAPTVLSEEGARGSAPEFGVAVVIHARWHYRRESCVSCQLMRLGQLPVRSGNSCASRSSTLGLKDLTLAVNSAESGMTLEADPSWN